ncbi:hypothetical protein GWI33_017938 [Rhynchophorus ferrugineus]|uniref:Uncharacterized protein n=1 Tax=Rhynchophorus ferrugineus TaxID=354439 RepID=A0A834HYA6_RHYFE|nr:hypothetical protein GWI33_017938 [Rhynchophorus ferrugineus]
MSSGHINRHIPRSQLKAEQQKAEKALAAETSRSFGYPINPRNRIPVDLFGSGPMRKLSFGQAFFPARYMRPIFIQLSVKLEKKTVSPPGTKPISDSRECCKICGTMYGELRHRHSCCVDKNLRGPIRR